MRYIIYGAGGIGGTIGARLFLTGAEVVLIARGAHYDAIAGDGLHFIAPSVDRVLKIPAVAHPADLEFSPGDVVLMCMKGQHTYQALQDLVICAGDQVAVVCCQNGVANEMLAIRYFARVYGMVVLLPGVHLQPGEVINHAEGAAGCLDAGCFPEGVDATIEAVCAGLQQAGFLSAPNASIMRLKYAKLLGNLMNVVDAATGERSAEIARLLRDEALACYQAAGIDVASAQETAARFAGIGRDGVTGHGRGGSSSWQSLARGTGNIEADFLNGEIVQLGRRFGVPAPANLAAQRLGQRLVREKLGPGALTNDLVMAQIRSAMEEQAKPL